MTKKCIRCACALAAWWCVVPPVAYAVPHQVVHVTLQDSSDDSSMAGMRMKLDVGVVKAGPVTLQAINASRSNVHEVLIVPAPRRGTALPYDDKQGEVIERRVHSLGEISDLQPGARGQLTLDLRPGHYLLLCNQPGHYKAGMSASLAVER